ncbi:MAG: hypothetical protein KC587_15080 [Nitrospira sp.]|nr:hypothetical protein [Nitrospira sp.]
MNDSRKFRILDKHDGKQLADDTPWPVEQGRIKTLICAATDAPRISWRYGKTHTW